MKVKDVVLEMHQEINTVADKVEYVEYGIPIIQSKNFTKGYLDLEDVRYLNKEDENKYIEKYSPHKADILLANIGTIGKSYVIKEEQKFLIAWNVFLIKPNREKVLSDFLKYYFDYLASTHYFEGLLTGGTVKFINKAKIGDIALPDINIDKQTQICNLLCAVEELIIKREKELQLLDELIKARFVEMFGNPVDNSRKDKVELSEICEKITDGEHGSVARVPSGHPFLNAKHVLKNGRIDWATITYVGDEDHQRIYKRCNPVEGDILLTTTGTIGNVAIMPKSEEVSMDRGITLLKIDRKKVTSEFVAELLKQPSIQAEMGVNVHASAIGHLFMNKVKKLPAILPLMESQVEFTDFVRQVDKSKAAVKKALDEVQLLFDSLMQKYFG